jgi:hypothetical protein
MPSDDGLEEAAELALTQLIEAIYQRSEALAHDVSAEEYSLLDRKVSESDESWKLARQRLRMARQTGVDQPERTSRLAGLPVRFRSA